MPPFMSLEIKEGIGEQKLKVKKTVFTDVRVFPEYGLEPSFVLWWGILKSIQVGCSNNQGLLLHLQYWTISGDISDCHSMRGATHI